MPTVKATARGIKMSPRKVGVVAGLVRNHTVEDALTILGHTPRRSALPVKKVIESARANADHNHNLKPETLKLVSITVTAGKSIKRGRPVAKGAYHPYQLRTSHIFVEVDGEERQVKKPTPTKPASKKETK